MTATLPETGMPFGLTPDWRHHAACIGQGNVFLPRDERYTDEARARDICGGCPVRSECLGAALDEEGTADQYRRAGIRGGLNPLERAQLVGCVQHTPSADRVTVEDQASFAALEQILREGELSDTAAALAVGIPRSTVSAFRQELGLPPLHKRVTPQTAFNRHAVAVEDGHVDWTRPSVRRQVSVRGRYYDVAQLAFLVGHGREAEGHVKRSCDRPGCVAWQHLTDRQIRNARANA